jgi:hypothetical protein
MKNYLEGYLDILPQVQRNKIQEIIKTNGGTTGESISESEFTEIIRRIAEDHEQQTEFVQQGERVSSRFYNQFFGNFQMDLGVMFAEADLVERALSSYERLYDGTLSSLDSEVKALRERISSLRLVAEGEDGLIVKSFDFTNTTDMETDRAQYPYLFKDRDGSEIPTATIQKNNDKSYLCLSKTADNDRVHDSSGRAVATFLRTDQRGMPETQSSYPVANAIDDSKDSYWGEIVLTDEPLNVGMGDVEAGGALVKFTMTLLRPEIVSEISITPFTTYPMEIVSIGYEEDVETYHPIKGLVTEPKESVQTMVFQFPSIIAKRFTFVIRQKNYTKNTYLVREKEISKSDLWDKISKRETEVTLATTSNVTVSQTDVDTYSGWDIYQDELTKYESDYAQYVIDLQNYNAAKAVYETDVVRYQTAYSAYQSLVSQYNSSYNRYGAYYTAVKNALE